MKEMPYQTAVVGADKYWDYNLKIDGVVYEISVNTVTGKIFINKDENQGG